MTSPSHNNSLRENDLNEYLDIFELSGITNKHKKETKRAIEKYLNNVQWKIDKQRSLSYFKHLQNNYSIAYYKKQMYQIMKFLKHEGANWVKEIKLPSDPYYSPKRITNEDIQKTIDSFKNNTDFKRIKALILLGRSSGLRAEELYKLTINDIDLDKRLIYIRHDLKINHSTKTGKSRISFFTEDAEKALIDFLGNNRVEGNLFPQSTFTKLFSNSNIKVKDLRKAFSQEWTRRQGDTGVKKLLMGHSLKNDVDLMHYNAQSEEDLKKIYDRIMNKETFESV